MNEQRIHQAGKIRLVRVTGEICPELKISRIFSKIHQQLHLLLMSKNIMFHNNPSIIASFIPGAQSMPTT
jgi:hypothetical protein